MDEVIDLLKIKIEKAKRELSFETVNAIDAVDWKAAILGLRSKYGYNIEQLGDLELETELLLCGLVTPENYPKELENRMKIPRAKANELVNEMNDLVFKKIREELIKNTERKKIFGKNSPLKEYPLGGGEPIPAIRTSLGQSTTEIVDAHEDTSVLHSVGIEIIPGKLELVAPHLEKPAENREDMLKNIEKSETVRPVNVPGAPVAVKTAEDREDILKNIEAHPVRSRPLENESATVTLGRPASNEAHPILAQKLSRPFQVGAVKTEHTLENITRAENADSGAGKSSRIDPYREIPE